MASVFLKLPYVNVAVVLICCIVVISDVSDGVEGQIMTHGYKLPHEGYV